MKTENISFGQLVKVNSSFETASQIAQIANNRSKCNLKLKSEIKKIFTDLNKCPAHAFYYDNRISYIFSGKEGEQFEALYEDLLIKNHHRDKDDKQLREKIWDDFRQKVIGIINKSDRTITIDPEVKNGKVRTLNYCV